MVHVPLKPGLENFEHYFASMWDECMCSGLNILWYCISLGLEWKLTFSSPVANAEFSKFAGILSAALSQHHLLGFEIVQLEFIQSIYVCVCVCVCMCLSLSWVRLFVTPWAVARQSSQSMKFSRQEYWSGLPFPSPGDLPEPEIERGSPTLEADPLPSELPVKLYIYIYIHTHTHTRGLSGGSVVKNPPVMWDTWARSLVW